jgi:hypothetical protein
VVLAAPAEVKRCRPAWKGVHERRKGEAHQAQVRGRAHRRQGDVEERLVRLQEGEPGRPDAAAEAEPMQNLCGQHEAHEAVGSGRLVVARDERTNPLLQLGSRETVELEQLRTHEAPPPRRGDHEEPVGELVEKERKEVQHASVGRVEREDSGVAVSLAEQRRKAHELDEQLVGGEPRCSDGQGVCCGLEDGFGRGVERVGMDLTDPLHQQAHVVGCRRARGGGGRLRRSGGESEHRYGDGQDAKPHSREFNRTKIRLTRLIGQWP